VTWVDELRMVEMTEPTSSKYGSTEESPNRCSLARTTSFDLYDIEEDEEYQYLPLPEVDEDFLDEASAATVNNQRPRMYYMLLHTYNSLIFCIKH